MPIFAQISDMQQRFRHRDLVQLTDEDNTGEIITAKIDGALEEADAIITGYVASRHKNAHIFAGHKLLVKIACDLADFDLWRTDATEMVKDREKKAIKTLEDIAAGKIKLDDGVESAHARPGQIHSGDLKAKTAFFRAIAWADIKT